MRQVSSLGIGSPLVEQISELQQTRLFGDDSVRTWDFPGVRLCHGFTLPLAAGPDEGYSRAVFLFLLRSHLNGNSRTFESECRRSVRLSRTSGIESRTFGCG